MAYTYQQYEVQLSTPATPTSVASTGDKLTWAPLYLPHLVRAALSVITTAITVTATVVNFTKRPTAGSNTGISAGDVAILKHLTSYVAGQCVYKDGLATKISPKQEVVINVGTAATAGACVFGLLVEPNYETPANNTNMTATT